MEYRGIYVSITDDCGPNKGGYYCQVYSDINQECQVDDFCIHTEQLAENPDVNHWVRKYVDGLMESYSQKSATIALFHKFQDFQRVNGISALSVVKVMDDLNNEINVPPEELYVLAEKLIDGIYQSDDPFLYGERIAAIQTLSENGIAGNYYLENMSPDDAYNYLLQCTNEEFISVVDVVAKDNQEYYTASWLRETTDGVNASIRAFLESGSSLEDKIQQANARVVSSLENESLTAPTR